MARTRMRAAILVAVLAAVASTIAGCGGSSSSNTSSTANKTLTIGMSQAVTSLDDEGSNGGLFWPLLLATGNVAEGLTELNGQSSVVYPDLATSWQFVNPTTFRLFLRHGVTFQDGTAFNAAAVVANFRRILNPKVASNNAPLLDGVVNIQASGNYTVDLVTKGPDPILPDYLAELPIYSPASIHTTADLGSRIIGTGPYEIASATSSEVILKAFPKYWGSPPTFKQVKILAIPSDSARIAALQAGEVDIAYDIPVQNVKSVSKVIAAEGPDVADWRMDGTGGLTKDPRVREAIQLAVDRNAIRLALFGPNYAAPDNANPVAPNVFGYNPAVTAPAPNPSLAHKLLQEAGVLGKTIHIVSAEADPGANEFSQAMAQQLEAVGMKVSLRLVDNTTWINALTDLKGTNELVYVGEGSEQMDAGVTMTLVDAQGGSITQFPFNAYPQFMQELDAASTQLNTAQRLKDIQAAIATVNSANYFLYGYIPYEIYGVQQNLTFQTRHDKVIQFATVHPAT